MQAKLSEQQTRTKEAEETIELLKKENGVMKGHGVKLKNAQKEIDRLREAWSDKDVQLAEANSSASQQRHVGFPPPSPTPPAPSPPFPTAPSPAKGKLVITVKMSLMAPNRTLALLLQCMAITQTMNLQTKSDHTLTFQITVIVTKHRFTVWQVGLALCFHTVADHMCVTVL